MSDARQAIEKRRRDWIAAVNGRDIDAYLDVLAEDIVWLPPGQAAVHGHAAFADWVGPFFESYEYDFTLENSTVEISGGFAVEQGSFVTALTSLESGKRMTHEGTYLVIWRQDEDDRWVIERYLDGTYLKTDGVREESP